MCVPTVRKVTRPGEIIWVDVLHPSAIIVGGGEYLLVLIDEFTRIIEVYVHKILYPTTRKESEPLFVIFCANALNVNIGTLRADLGPEFVSNPFIIFCKSKGLGKSLRQHIPQCKTDKLSEPTAPSMR